uniref:Uncharacterized protein n=1 Tax=Aegilops tauschii subsp. strangulata TaxID=200361 RepID=A0A453B9J9_AEGTS
MVDWWCFTVSFFLDRLFYCFAWCLSSLVLDFFAGKLCTSQSLSGLHLLLQRSSVFAGPDLTTVIPSIR